MIDGSMILEEQIDEDYEPTQEEILEYADWLGMKLPQDRDLIYIAKEGLKAPLPEPWKPCKTQDDNIYYFNFETGESVWEHPCDSYYKQKFQEAKRAKSMSLQQNTRSPDKAFGIGGSKAGKRIGQALQMAPMQQPTYQQSTVNLDNKKDEMNEKFNQEKLKIQKEFEELKEAKQKEFEQQLEKKKQQLSKSFKPQTVNEEEKKRIFEERMQKLRAQSEIILQSEQQKLLQQKDERLRLMAQNHKIKIDTELQKGSSEASQIEDNNKKVQELQDDIEFITKKIQRENDEIEYERQRHEKRIKSMKQDVQDEINKQKQNFKANQEQDLQAELKLKQYEKELKEQYEAELNDYIMNLETELEGETYARKQKAEQQKQLMLEQYENQIVTEQLQKQQNYQTEKENELKNFENKLNVESALEIQQYEQDLFGDNQEYNIYNKTQQQLDLLTARKKQIEIEMETAKNKENLLTVQIANLQKDIENQDNNQHQLNMIKNQIHSVEQEILQIKIERAEKFKLLDSQMENFKILVQKEQVPYFDIDVDVKVQKTPREQLKEEQKMLEYDQQKWRRDIKEARRLNDIERMIHLKKVKEIIDKRIQKHNSKLNQYRNQSRKRKSSQPIKQRQHKEKQYQDWGKDSFDQIDITFDKHYNQRPYTPLRAYDKHLTKWNDRRTTVQDVIRKQSSWLNNLKFKLNQDLKSLTSGSKVYMY